MTVLSYPVPPVVACSKSLVSIVGLVCLLAVARSSDVQAQPSGSGTVILHSSLEGAPRSVTRVVLTDRAEPRRRRESTLDPASAARFHGLPPADYALALTVDGTSVAQIVFAVGANEVVMLAAKPGDGSGVAARIEVTARHLAGEGVVFDEQLVRDLPATGLAGLIETAAPFVIVDRFDSGGLAGAPTALFGSRGESWGLTEVAVGDARVTQATDTGLLGIVPDLAATDAVVVTSGLAPLGIGTPGVHVSLTPRMPGPRWTGSLRTAVTTRGMVGTNQLPHASSITRIESWQEGGLSAGGPLSSTTGLFLSSAALGTRFQERALDDRLVSRNGSLFGHLVSRIDDRNQVRAFGGVQAAKHPFEFRRQLRPLPSDAAGAFGQLQISWDRFGDDGSRRLLTAGFQRMAMSPDEPDLLTGGTVDRVLDGPVPPPLADWQSTSWNVRAEIDRPVFAWGRTSHAIIAGALFDRTELTTSIVSSAPIAETVAGLPARVWQPVVPSAASVRTATGAGVYVGDHIILGPRFTVDVGLRLAAARGRARGADQDITWTAVSPRVSFRWSPAFFGVFGGYGRSLAGNVLPLLAFGDPGEPWSEVHRWNDLDDDLLFDPGEAGVLVSRAGRGAPVASIDPELPAPVSQEWTIGAEFRPDDRNEIRGAIIVRRQKNLPGVVNTGVPLSSYRILEIPDANADEFSPDDDRILEVYERLPSSFGQDAYVLTSPEGARATYGGIEITWTLRSERWSMVFGAMAYRTRGWGGHRGPRATENDQLVAGERYADPNAAAEEAGSFFFDRSYVGKWAGSYRAPKGVTIAFAARYQDGQPFSRLVLLPDMSTGPEIVQAYRVGRTRYTYTATVDLRVEKAWRIGARRIALRLDGYNITNHRNEVEEDILTGPTFRQSTAVQPPVTVRVGFRVDF